MNFGMGAVIEVKVQAQGTVTPPQAKQESPEEVPADEPTTQQEQS